MIEVLLMGTEAMFTLIVLELELLPVPPVVPDLLVVSLGLEMLLFFE
jgi:hypothetical protein